MISIANFKSTHLQLQIISEIARFDLFRSVYKLQEEFLHWIPIRKRTVRELEELDLEEISNRLDEHHRNVNIATAAGATTSVLATGVAVAGFVSAFFTFGATIPVAIAGGVIGAAGGLTTFGSKMAEIFLSKLASDKVGAVLEEDQAACTNIRRCMSQLDELITRNVLKIVDSIGSREDVKFHRLEEIVKIFEDMTGMAILKTEQFDPITGGTRGVSAVLGAATSCTTAGIAGARVGTAVAFDSLSAAARVTHIAGFVVSILALPFDIYFLAKSSKELADGSSSEVAAKIRSIQSRLVFPEERQVADLVHAYVKDKVTEVARKQGIENDVIDSGWVIIEPENDINSEKKNQDDS